jgi:predicted AAA+ superfamily ATPase
MRAYAAASSTVASYEKIRDAATSGEVERPTRKATVPYRTILEKLWVVDPVPAWLPTRNRLRRLSSPPKHQLVDPALAVRLLGVDKGALLDARPVGPPIPRDGTLLGSLFESLVTLNVRVFAQAAEASTRHLRTAAGEHEVDLIVERNDGRIVALEVKLARIVDDDDLRDLLWLRDRIGPDLLDAVVVTTGDVAYRRPDGIGVVPAALLGP